MQEEAAIKELLTLACPSIQYRTRLELLNQPACSQEMADLQGHILQDKAVQKVISWQQPDGWLAWAFHGTRSTEGGIRLLCEKGVDPRYPILANALRALEMMPDRLDRGIGNVGKIFEEMGFGGTQMIRAAVFAYARVEDKPFIREQIGIALELFRAVLAIESLDDLAEEYKGNLVFKPQVKWPNIYCLRLLALTKGWRSAENRGLVAESVRRLVKLSPIPRIIMRHKSHVYVPGAFSMRDFDPDMASMDAKRWMMWFHRMELLSRLGVVNAVSELQRQVETLREMLDASGGRFAKELDPGAFGNWGAYALGMLEKDWRRPERRIYDLTFRSLLILHFA